MLANTCYFKSTDGHEGTWSFSHRRLNLHLLPLIDPYQGCIIVDSTHSRIKRLPDALSKTVPIWCCILNRLLFPNGPEESKWPFLPSREIVPEKESQEIIARIPSMEEGAKVGNESLVCLHR